MPSNSFAFNGDWQYKIELPLLAGFQERNGAYTSVSIGISTIYIRIISKEGYSYFDIQGGCSWDEEHGLNFLFHKDRVISFGGIDGSSYHSAKKDGGIYSSDQIQQTENLESICRIPNTIN